MSMLYNTLNAFRCTVPRAPIRERFVPLATMTTSKDEEDEKGQRSAMIDHVRKEQMADMKDMQWRTPMANMPGEWQSKFKVFADDQQTSDFITMMQQPLDFSPQNIKRWWTKRKERHERFMQQYIPERHQILGADLAAAHFLVYRGGAVKFTHSPGWVKADDTGKYNLPKLFDPLHKVEAIRCDNMKIYYEGLENLRCLQHLKFLSYKNVETFDDWCLDRVSGSQYPILETLDISGTKCTSRGLWCLYRIPTLKRLIVDNQKSSKEYELTCALLEISLPQLEIYDEKSAKYSKKDYDFIENITSK